MNYNLTFGAWAHKKWKAEGPALPAVLDALGLGDKSKTHLYRLFNGNAEWTLEKMAGFAQLYGYSIGQLLLAFERENDLLDGYDALMEIEKKLEQILDKAISLQKRLQGESENNPAA